MAVRRQLGCDGRRYSRGRKYQNANQCSKRAFLGMVALRLHYQSWMEILHLARDQGIFNAVWLGIRWRLLSSEGNSCSWGGSCSWHLLIEVDLSRTHRSFCLWTYADRTCTRKRTACTIFTRQQHKSSFPVSTPTLGRLRLTAFYPCRDTLSRHCTTDSLGCNSTTCFHSCDLHFLFQRAA